MIIYLWVCIMAYSLFDGYWCVFDVDLPVELDTQTYLKCSEMRSVHMILSKLSFFSFSFYLFSSFSSVFVERQTKQLWKLGQFAINPINAISESNFVTREKKRFGTFGWFFISLFPYRRDLCTLAHLCVISFSDIFISFIHLDCVLWSMHYLRLKHLRCICVCLIIIFVCIFEIL